MTVETRKLMGKLFITQGKSAYKEYYEEFKEEIDEELKPKEEVVEKKSKRKY